MAQRLDCLAQWCAPEQASVPTKQVDRPAASARTLRAAPPGAPTRRGPSRSRMHRIHVLGEIVGNGQNRRGLSLPSELMSSRTFHRGNSSAVTLCGQFGIGKSISFVWRRKSLLAPSSMLYAIDDAGRQIEAQRSGEAGICPCCRGQVVAKCGDINAWHWAHRAGPDCDKWSEPTTNWHRNWQRYLATLGARIEVAIGADGVRHRADAVLRNGFVVELQHSGISPAEIAEREDFYKRMIWVFDVTEAYAADRFNIRERQGFDSFRWKQPRKAVAFARAPVRLDLGSGEVFRLKAMRPDAPCGGWGKWSYVPDLDTPTSSTNSIRIP